MLEQWLGPLILGFMIVNLFMMYRNHVVFRFRVKTLMDFKRPPVEAWQRYYALPPYQKMVYQVWRFDWSDYFPPSTKD